MYYILKEKKSIFTLNIRVHSAQWLAFWPENEKLRPKSAGLKPVQSEHSASFFRILHASYEAEKIQIRNPAHTQPISIQNRPAPEVKVNESIVSYDYGKVVSNYISNINYIYFFV